MATGPLSRRLAIPALLVWTLVLPDVASAQRAVPRGGTSEGEAAQPPRGEARPRVAPRPDRSESERPAAPEPTGRGQSGSAAEAAHAPAGDAASGTDANGQAPPHSRSRGESPQVGTAVQRRTAPPSPGGQVIVVRRDSYGGYYPWGYGGLGFGGYSGYYDPWYAGHSPQYGFPPQYYEERADGAVRLKVKPRDASVYVDGYYVGRVDDFDGIFQRLPLEAGPHRIEIRADDYQSLSVDIRILPDRTIIYTGELEPVP